MRTLDKHNGTDRSHMLGIILAIVFACFFDHLINASVA